MRASILFLAVAVSACFNDETISGYAPDGATFALQSIDDTPFSASATISFPEQGKITGQGPCNSYSGAQTVPYPWFNVDGIAATRRACPELDAEQTFFTALTEMSLAEISGDTLILSNDDGRKMVFTAQN